MIQETITWVSVKDKLPNDRYSRRVLTIDENGYLNALLWTGKDWRDMDNHVAFTPTHWAEIKGPKV